MTTPANPGRTTHIHVRMSPKDVAALKKLAKHYGWTGSQVVRFLIARVSEDMGNARWRALRS